MKLGDKIAYYQNLQQNLDDQLLDRLAIFAPKTADEGLINQTIERLYRELERPADLILSRFEDAVFYTMRQEKAPDETW